MFQRIDQREWADYTCEDLRSVLDFLEAQWGREGLAHRLGERQSAGDSDQDRGRDAAKLPGEAQE